MQRKIVTGAVCGMLLLGNGWAAQAMDRPLTPCGPEHQSPAMAMRPPHCQAPLQEILDRLDLSDSQREAVKKHLDGSMKRDAAQEAKLKEIMRQWRQVERPKNFDEKRLRELARQKSAIESELMIGRANTRHDIYMLLTPEQKELFDLAEKLRLLRPHVPMPEDRPLPEGHDGGRPQQP